MPERQHLARWPGAKAVLPCGYCNIQGTRHGTQYVPQGYCTPVLHDRTFLPARHLYANAEELWVTDICAPANRAVVLRWVVHAAELQD